jgi:hypothetical protein
MDMLAISRPGGFEALLERARVPERWRTADDSLSFDTDPARGRFAFPLLYQDC